ncbi:MAG: hypothetical protein CW346_14715 [Bacillaceae bacterium]|nr:hypothetical protein [Bacillaceae bacterium]
MGKGLFFCTNGKDRQKFRPAFDRPPRSGNGERDIFPPLCGERPEEAGVLGIGRRRVDSPAAGWFSREGQRASFGKPERMLREGRYPDDLMEKLENPSRLRSEAIRPMREPRERSRSFGRHFVGHGPF